MRKLITPLLMILAVLTPPLILKAQDSPKPQKPNPETLFNRLDANKDGAVTSDELPPGMPERLKQLILKADKNGDKQFTLEELKAAFKDRQQANHERPRGEGRGGPGPEGRPEGKPGKSMGDVAVQRIRANLPEMPDLKEVFNRLDTDKDGKLSIDEFKAGAMKFHQLLASRAKDHPPANRIAGRPDEWQPRPWLAMQQTGWEHAGYHGPHGRGPQFCECDWGHGPQFHGQAMHRHQGHHPQYNERGRGHGPQAHGYAMHQHQGRGPQLHGYPMDQSPHKHWGQMAQSSHKHSGQSDRRHQHQGGKGHKTKSSGDRHDGKNMEVKKHKEKSHEEQRPEK